MDNGICSTTPEALVENVLQLISPPEIYLRLQSVIDDPLHTREQVAAIVAFDPSLSVRVLRIANSSYYSFPREIETVESAVGVIGEIDLRNMVLAATVVGSMNALNCRGVNIDEFWVHSLRCGINARLIAKAVGSRNPEILFLAGILHDLGILVIYQQDVDLANTVLLQMDVQHQMRDQAEREILGFDHAEVGALLIEAWGLSDELSELARCHHQYQLAKGDQQPALMLALANTLAIENPSIGPESDIQLGGMLKQLGIDQEGLAELIEIGEQQCAEVRNIILG